MSASIDDYDDLTTFVRRLMARTPRPGETAASYFRGVEIRCAARLGGRCWTVYGAGPGEPMSFTSGIGWDEEDYVTDRLIRSGLLPIERD